MHVGTCAVIQEMIVQITSYPNLISIFIESLSCSYHLYNDIVPYSILQFLKNTPKSKLDYCAVGISPWFQNIACFAGEFFRTYYKTEMTGILTYIAECLESGQVAEIFILKQILSKMSGWNPPEKLTEKMLNSLAGGPKLKIATYKLGEDRSRTTKSSQALCKALQLKRGDGKLNFSMELAILAGQQARQILYSECSNFKLLELSHDNLMSSIVLLVDILSLQFNESKTYAELLPSQPIVVLTQEYKLPLPLVMYIVRPGIDVSKFENVIEQLEIIVQDSQIPIQFLAIFWALSLADIRSVEGQYTSEINLLKQSDKNKQIIDQLSTELSFLQYRQKFFADFIKKHANIPKNCNLIVELVQKGIYPRLLCSPSDALYCAYFIETVLKLQIEEFSVLDLISNCISLILPCLHCCTEGEASNLGLFFLELLKILSGWMSSLDSDGKTCLVLRVTSIKNFRENYNAYHSMILGILTDGLAGSFLDKKNCLNIINRISPEFPDSKENALIILKQILPIKDSNMEDLKLLAQRVYDNLDRKFTEKNIIVLQQKRSHERDEDKGKNGEFEKVKKSEEKNKGRDGKNEFEKNGDFRGLQNDRSGRPRDGRIDRGRDGRRIGREDRDEREMRQRRNDREYEDKRNMRKDDYRHKDYQRRDYN